MKFLYFNRSNDKFFLKTQEEFSNFLQLFLVFQPVLEGTFSCKIKQVLRSNLESGYHLF